MVQTALNAFPDTVDLPDPMGDDDITNLLFQESYRMFGRSQLKYTIGPDGKIAAVLLGRYNFLGGATKFMPIPYGYLTSGPVTVRGVEIDLAGNSTQMLIRGETSVETQKLPIPVSGDGTATAGYVAARIGLEGRVPNFALLGRDDHGFTRKSLRHLAPMAATRILRFG